MLIDLLINSFYDEFFHKYNVRFVEHVILYGLFICRYIHYQYTFMGEKNMINDAFAASSTHICLSAPAEVSTDEVKTFQLLN